MLVRVFELKFTAPDVAKFWHLDWFMNDHAPMGRTALEEFVKQKPYYNPELSYLVLCQAHCFTINY